MGVIRNLSNLENGFSDSIEDVLNEIEEQAQNYEVEHRRIRKIKHRPSKPHAVGGTHSTNAKSGKKKKRIDNCNFLLSLGDPEEASEISIHDFIPPSVSVFSQVLSKPENMEIWNELINCADLESCFQAIMPSFQPSKETAELAADAASDGRSCHPAYSAVECFRKIDNDLRCLLRKKHIPMGLLIYLERELVTFFINRPQSVYHSHIPNSFERLLLHALCQYMDLSALSYNRNDARWTRVRNNRPAFISPSVLLSTYLEQRILRGPR